MGLEGDRGHGMDGCFSIDEECIWIDESREGGVVEVEAHWERKVKWCVGLCVMGVVKEHVKGVGWIQHKIGDRVVGAVHFRGAHRRQW